MRRCARLAALLVLATATAAAAAVHEVPQSYPTIQQAIDAAVAGDTVLVAPGTYSGLGNRNLDFLGKDIVLRSVAGAEATIIDCEMGARGIHLHSGETRAALVEGFTIRNGMAAYVYGGGLFCDGSSPTIRDCVVEACRHSGTNGAGGGVCFRDSNALMERCVIRDCATEGFGGGIACRGTVSPVISDCLVIHNSAAIGGGGIDAGGIGEPHILRCEIAGNRAASAGGGVVLGGAAVVEGCTIDGNLSRDGAGAYCANGSSTRVISTTIAGNYAWSGDGGGLSAFGFVSIARSILWGNCCGGIGDQAIAGDGGAVTLECSITDPAGVVEDGGEVAYLEGNVFLDPLFCGPLPCESSPSIDGDYTIDRDSPALPGGNPCGSWIGSQGVGCPPSGVREADETSRTMIRGVVPNPSMGRIACAIELPSATRVILDLIDARGGRVALLHEGELPAGRSTLDLETAGGQRPIPAGAYFLRLVADGIGEDTRTVIIAR